MPIDCKTVSNCETVSPSERTASSDYSEVLRRFELAIAAYKAQADPLTLLLLNKSAIPLMDAQPHTWQSIDDPAALDPEQPFTAIRAVCDQRLSDAQVGQLTGCLGYALQAILAGPELSLPNVAYLEAPTGSGIQAAFTLVEFAYDARLSGRTAPDYVEALAKAREFIRDGTPIRTTNTAGAGTQGTRLVEGLGAVRLSLFVR